MCQYSADKGAKTGTQGEIHKFPLSVSDSKRKLVTQDLVKGANAEDPKQQTQAKKLMEPPYYHAVVLLLTCKTKLTYIEP